MARYLVLSVKVLLMSALLDITWHIGHRNGYNQAITELSRNWYEGPEGYCLAEGGHVGPCRD